MQRHSYAWALDPDVCDLALQRLRDHNERRGFQCARELAEAAKARSRQNLHPDPSFEALTLAKLAREEGLSPSTLSRQIKQARRALLGEISDAAIYKRTQRRRQPRHKGFRRCHHQRCEEHLAAAAHGNQKYCAAHATSAERTRRSRRKANAGE